MLPTPPRSTRYPCQPLDGCEDEEGPEEARRWALEAARTATEILEERHELAISVLVGQVRSAAVDLLRSTGMDQDRKSTRLNSSHANISYAVFCLKKKNIV